MTERFGSDWRTWQTNSNPTPLAGSRAPLGGADYPPFGKGCGPGLFEMGRLVGPLLVERDGSQLLQKSHPLEATYRPLAGRRSSTFRCEMSGVTARRMIPGRVLIDGTGRA